MFKLLLVTHVLSCCLMDSEILLESSVLELPSLSAMSAEPVLFSCHVVLEWFPVIEMFRRRPVACPVPVLWAPVKGQSARDSSYSLSSTEDSNSEVGATFISPVKPKHQDICVCVCVSCVDIYILKVTTKALDITIILY